jgi:hypothetical protein
MDFKRNMSWQEEKCGVGEGGVNHMANTNI